MNTPEEHASAVMRAPGPITVAAIAGAIRAYQEEVKGSQITNETPSIKSKTGRTDVFEIHFPGESAAGLRSFDDTVSVSCDSGDWGGGAAEFQEHIKSALAEWYNEAEVAWLGQASGNTPLIQPTGFIGVHSLNDIKKIDQLATDLNRATASLQVAVDTLKQAGYTYHGGELWKPPLGRSADLLLEIIDSIRAERDRITAERDETIRRMNGRQLQELWLKKGILMTRKAAHDAAIEYQFKPVDTQEGKPEIR